MFLLHVAMELIIHSYNGYFAKLIILK